MPVPPTLSTSPFARMRSVPARALSASVSRSWNLTDELPQLRTRTFMPAPSVHGACQPLDDREGGQLVVDGHRSPTPRLNARETRGNSRDTREDLAKARPQPPMGAQLPRTATARPPGILV